MYPVAEGVSQIFRCKMSGASFTTPRRDSVSRLPFRHKTTALYKIDAASRVSFQSASTADGCDSSISSLSSSVASFGTSFTCDSPRAESPAAGAAPASTAAQQVAAPLATRRCSKLGTAWPPRRLHQGVGSLRTLQHACNLPTKGVGERYLDPQAQCSSWPLGTWSVASALEVDSHPASKLAAPLSPPSGLVTARVRQWESRAKGPVADVSSSRPLVEVKVEVMRGSRPSEASDSPRCQSPSVAEQRLIAVLNDVEAELGPTRHVVERALQRSEDMLSEMAEFLADEDPMDTCGSRPIDISGTLERDESTIAIADRALERSEGMLQELFRIEGLENEVDPIALLEEAEIRCCTKSRPNKQSDSSRCS